MPYLEKTWIESSRFNPTAWSTYGMEIRTNNHCEGWHSGLNRAGIRPGFYQLLERLAKKMDEADMSIRRVSEDVPVGRVECPHRRKQIFLQEQWQSFQQKRISARRLLKIVANSEHHVVIEDM